MTEDNVRKIWSDAELDAALTDLHSDVGDDDGLVFARASLLAAAGAEPEEPPKPRRSGSWRWIAVAAAVVTLAGGFAVAAEVLSPGAPAPVHPAATAPDLDRPLAPGEYHYSRQEYWYPVGNSSHVAYVQQKVELWVPADPAGTWHRRRGLTGRVVGHLTDDDRAKIVPMSEADEYGLGGVFPSPGGRPVLWQTPDARFLESLTPDETALSARLAGTSLYPAEQLRQAASALTPGFPAKDVRVALCKALASLGGIQAYPDPVQAPDGRQSLAFLAPSTQDTLYVDPATFVAIAITPYAPLLHQYPVGGPTTETVKPPTPLSTPVSVTTPESFPKTTTPLSPPSSSDQQPPTMFYFAITHGSS
ncbi:hypothetical protein VA596_06430 [Amycolatopsis sp., V23-08]|uniref:CU044_5270 family protein n=1 Tax=Amycolatopsis heterodermiae TaxID=3110235 RepID=A0ABU5QZ16_9PSEU|nr:hypothetical protein [Amycolatopsis sp., V23-08]MEA5359167.1 hypothetical protein [Amycolatopsis sp., V23-08]